MMVNDYTLKRFESNETLIKELLEKIHHLEAMVFQLSEDIQDAYQSNSDTHKPQNRFPTEFVFDTDLDLDFTKNEHDKALKPVRWIPVYKSNDE